MQVLWVQLPLLARVPAEELLVELPADLGHDRVLRGLDQRALLAAVRVEGLDVRIGRQLEPIEAIDRVAVDRHRQELAVHALDDSVLVRPPLGEAREVLDDLLRIRVEDVRSIAVDEHSVLVEVVVRVPGDVVPAVDDEHPLAELGRQPLGDDRAGESRADHEGVVCAHEWTCSRSPSSRRSAASSARSESSSCWTRPSRCASTFVWSASREMTSEKCNNRSRMKPRATMKMAEGA